MYFALIKAGIVDNVIVADQAFVDSISPSALGVDSIIEVPDENRPGVGWTYDGSTFAPGE